MEVWDIHVEKSPKLPIYAALGVSEVWRYGNGTVEIRCFTTAGYERADSSQALPGMTAALVQQFLEAARTAANRTAWFKGVVAAVAGRSTTG